MFKTGDKVQVSSEYPHDRTYPYPHGYDMQMWGLIGTVVGRDDTYIFVTPMGIFTDWPAKYNWDAYPDWWHFLPEELTKL